VRDPRTAVFGFGRRICPGQYLADDSLFAIVATVLATVDIGRAVRSDGTEHVPAVDVTSGFVSHPKPFEYTLRPRGTKTAAMLKVSIGNQHC
jgi:cytochrome P450